MGNFLESLGITNPFGGSSEDKAKEDLLRDPGSPPTGNNAVVGAGIDKGSGPDEREISQTSASSGGSGGLFGNASANLGDVGLGTSSATSGDIKSTFDQSFSFAGPVVNKSPWWLVPAVAAAGVGLFIWRRK